MKHVIVVGNGMVGYKFCEKIRAKVKGSQIKITVFGEEVLPAYDRVHLSDYFQSKNKEDLFMASRKWYEENDIELITGTLVTDINREDKSIKTHDGQELSYDHLVLATGSSAFVPPIPGVDKKGVFVYRTLEDLDAILDYGKQCKDATVIGGGLLGLEAAKAVIDMGLKAKVVEMAPRLMPRQLDDRGAQMLQSGLEEMGIEFHLSKRTEKVLGNGSIEALGFQNDETLPTDMVIISAGIKPRDELGRQSGLAVGPRGGIVVNSQLQTSDPSIYAIGEVALYRDMIYGLVAPGYDMAEIVASQIAEEEFTPFTGADMSTKLKLVGTDVGSFGDALLEENTGRTIVVADEYNKLYKRINISEDGKKLLGGILVGDTSRYNILHQMVLNDMPLPPHPEDLIAEQREGGAPIGNGVADLPDTAQVCSCENVTKGGLCSAIEEQELSNLDEIKACTKAGTGCGGCIPMVTDLMKDVHKKMGKEVKNVICEHFDYSRQELLSIIKVKNIRTYDQLLKEYGTGNGCETCKPAVASILASTWNELITEQATIQDTNDRFLANIQRGGTYSVVPRVAGGEITPDKLIVLGQVAKKYDLYLKITGGQRIDMFGAHVGDLPDIWEELINAGFESGHAYGKSLRTVKSCVGSTWCRYGLHDSVTFAIDVENRYKGLRAPHKLKGGVSGCIRECAEARGKDFGIIATEKGWNLYVGGNGGSKPQHAELLAADISSEDCIKYLDRFLMFYIKTAEPLNRTATWMNKLEGGLDYVIDVVVNDSLGIGEELERDMQQLIDVYKCEWTEVVNNPELRKKFRHFANSDEKDPNIKFEPMREQKKPVKW
ncbi:nitrite reductase large subunit NirB [Sediminitomix flava]|uniref:Assimilatory nitrite reductase (NAD(P)H) large subunit n=1 Tax=Sediminitomix flava TaxID=379075 RepID=A0A315ZBC2_SEDFL|nr:nitrite reductase large subunit NirB [Sediminitomix flava]PWJ42875.1 assimilatory nitrite reductase (NAD(P)H) large subunit precursor [Sediminitomix flava]